MVESGLWGVKEAARYLGIHEKVVYRLIRERGLPATKITGKWLFRKELLDRWLDAPVALPTGDAMLLACSDDPLLDAALERCAQGALFATRTGSRSALDLLASGAVHLAGAHLLDAATGLYNLPHLSGMEDDLLVVALAERTQGLVLPRGNPMGVGGLRDVVERGLPLLTREATSGTYRLLEVVLEREGLSMQEANVVAPPALSHLEVGLRIRRGEAAAGLSIGLVPALLGLDFLPLHKERYDLVVRLDHVKRPQVKTLLSFLGAPEFERLSDELGGYDCRTSGRLVHS